MDKPKQVTNLTQDVFEKLFGETGKGGTAVVQVLARLERVISNQTYPKAVISNGFFKVETFIHPTAVLKFNETVRINDIIRVTISRRPNNTQILISEFEIVYTDIKFVVGQPIDYTPGAQNRTGSTFIAEIAQQHDPQAANGANHGHGDNGAPLVQLRQEEEKDGKFYRNFGELTPFDRDFTVRGRLIKKEQLKRFRNKQGQESQLFSFILYDGEMEIQGTFYGEIADRYYLVMEEGQVYSINHAEVKSDDKFNATKCKYTLGFGRNAEVVALRDQNRIPRAHFDFASLDQIQGIKPKEKVDIMAIVGEVGPMEEFVSKTGQKMAKRELILYDESKTSSKLTLWRDMAAKFQSKKEDIIILKNAVVDEYQEKKQLGCSYLTQLITALHDCEKLKDLITFQRNNGGKQVAQLQFSSKYRSLKQFVFLSEIERLMEDIVAQKSDKQIYFNVSGFIFKFTPHLSYESCTQEKCKRKVTRQDDGTYHCAACNVITAEPGHKFFTKVAISDGSKAMPLLVSNEKHCTQLFGIPLKELLDLKKNSFQQFEDQLRLNQYKSWCCRVSAKYDNFMGKDSVRLTLIDLSTFDACSKELIQQYLTSLKNLK